MLENNYYRGLSKQEKILISNVRDKYESYLQTGNSTYTNFLNPHELYLVTSYLNSCHIPYSIYEPYSFLEKKIIYFGKYDNYVTFYRITTKEGLSHQQVLRYLFSIGFHENTIGDIFIENGICYYTNLTKLNYYLEENMKLINHQVVTLKQVEEINLQENHFELFTILVSSMRLDNIVSKIASKSRSQVDVMVRENNVFLNYEEVKNSSISLKENDILSIRKSGKYKIGNSTKNTKKGNIVLEIYKYV